jgi:hypothetical protein
MALRDIPDHDDRPEVVALFVDALVAGLATGAPNVGRRRPSA